MFGYRWVKESGIVEKAFHEVVVLNLEERLAELREYVTKCESLIESERGRVETERKRADRQIDRILQQSGLPPVTETTIQEDAERSSTISDRYAEQLRQEAEIFSETATALDIQLPEGIRDLLKPVNDVTD